MTRQLSIIDGIKVEDIVMHPATRGGERFSVTIGDLMIHVEDREVADALVSAFMEGAFSQQGVVS